MFLTSPVAIMAAMRGSLVAVQAYQATSCALTNGNTPLVSAHEVAWYAWTATKDPRMAAMIATGEVKNMVDLCYQTLALAEMDGEKYREQIQKNAARILSLQRPDGQWAMRFEASQPEVEFQ